MNWKAWHRWTGLTVIVFVAAHLINHLWAFIGIEAHQHLMSAMRHFYRHPVLETLLIACFLFQALSGVRLFFKWRQGADQSRWTRVQAISGVAFGFFILNHIGSALFQRWQFGVDTDFYYAARVLVEQPYVYFFLPYYATGIMAFGIHVASIHGSKIQSRIGYPKARQHFILIAFLFSIMTACILWLFSGGAFPIEFPVEYLVF